MKEITIRLEEKEHSVVSRIAALKGLSLEEYVLDSVRLSVDGDLHDKVSDILDIGTENEPIMEERAACL